MATPSRLLIAAPEVLLTDIVRFYEMVCYSKCMCSVQLTPGPTRPLLWAFTMLLYMYTFSQIIDPTCSCPSNYFLNSHMKCQCVASKWCSHGSTWNAHECKCIKLCDTHHQDCDPGFNWNEDQCRCICGLRPCLHGQHFDLTQCKCVCLNAKQICPFGLSWDPEICDCNLEW